MASIPTSATSAAAQTSVRLAGVVEQLAVSTPAPRAVASSCRRTCRTIADVLSVRILTNEDARDLIERLILAAQAFARMADQEAVARDFYDAAAEAAASVPTSSSPILTRRYRLARAMSAGVEAALLGAAFVAEARVAIEDRQSAVAARNRIDGALAEARDRIASGIGERGAAVLSGAARNASNHIAQQAASLKPIVRVTVTNSYPSIAMAWRLYGDPTRSRELLRRTRCGTPMFIPVEFEAVSPNA